MPQIAVDFRQCKIGKPVIEEILSIAQASKRGGVEIPKDMISKKAYSRGFVILGKTELDRAFLASGEAVNNEDFVGFHGIEIERNPTMIYQTIIRPEPERYQYCEPCHK